ncbi:MAG: endonuclease III domain-containing protein [Desulfopila sp.]
MQDTIFEEMYGALYAHYGPQNWWPGETALEMVVGAVLTQNTNWKNVDKAIANLKHAGVLGFEALCSVSHDELAERIRPAGYYNVKTKRLKNVLRMIMEEYDGDLQQLLDDGLESARSNLLAVNGIGEETADSILLYGAGHAIFVVDTYTHRVFSRHNLVEEECGYGDVQERFMDNLAADAVLFNEYHALIVRVAKEYCKKNTPLCGQCPLHDFL